MVAMPILSYKPYKIRSHFLMKVHCIYLPNDFNNLRHRGLVFPSFARNKVTTVNKTEYPA
jgi:hypothetical protein